MKKIIKLSLILAMMVSLSSVAAADAVQPRERKTEQQVVLEEVNGVGLSVNPPISEEKGTTIPTKVHDVTIEGAYDFSGSSEYQSLYTSYLITGQDDYRVTVHNYSDHNLTVMVKTRFNTFSTNTLAPNSENSFTVASVGADTKFYIKFKGSLMDFAGTIE